MSIGILSVLIVAGLALLYRFALSDHRRAVQWREGLLDDCRPLLGHSQIRIGPDRHPILRGRYGAHPVRIGVFTDTLVTRRLPQLWCELVIERPVGAAAAIGVLVRPTGAEYYARTHTLALRLDVPPAWPGNAIVRADSNVTADTLRAVESALAPMLADPRVKEIVIGPEGASVIWQAAEGDRGAHLILRQSVFPVGRIPADEVAARLDVLAQLQLTPRVQTRDPISAEHAA